MKMVNVLAVVVLAVVLGGAGQASAELIVNGGFETGDWSPWVMTETAADAAYSAANGGFPTTQVQPGIWGTWGGTHSGSKSAAFGGQTDPIGDTVVQTVTTWSGPLTLSFWVNDNFNGPADPSKLTASWNGTPVVSLAWPPLTLNGTWTQYSVDVTGTGSDTLQFAGYGFTWFTLLDDVSLVPEPASMGLMIAALGGAFWLRMRRNSR